MRAARRGAPQGQGNRPDQGNPAGAVPVARMTSRAIPAPSAIRRSPPPPTACAGCSSTRPISTAFRWRSSISTSMRCAPSCANTRAPTSPRSPRALTAQAAAGDRRIPGRREPAPAGLSQGDLEPAAGARRAVLSSRCQLFAAVTAYAAIWRSSANSRSRRRPPDPRRTSAPLRARPRPRSGAAASAAARRRRSPRVSQRVSTRSMMRRLSRLASPGSLDEAVLAHRLERLAERPDRSKPAARPCRRARGSRSPGGRARCRRRGRATCR